MLVYSLYDERSTLYARCSLILGTMKNGGKIILGWLKYSTEIRKLNGLCFMLVYLLGQYNVNLLGHAERMQAERTKPSKRRFYFWGEEPLSEKKKSCWYSHTIQYAETQALSHAPTADAVSQIHDFAGNYK